MEKDADTWQVKLLDTDFEPVSKPCKPIERVYNSRRQCHDLAMIKLAQELNMVNERSKKDVHMSSEQVKEQMDAFTCCLSLLIADVNIPEIAAFHGSVFRDIQRNAKEHKLQQLALVQEFHQDLIESEAKRSKESKRIFHESFEEISRISYLLPCEIQSLVEQETLKMNQLSLNNRRCYEDIKLKLTLVTEETFKTFMDELFCKKDKWIRWQMDKARDRMIEAAEETALATPEVFARLELKGQELVLRSTADGRYQICEANLWLENLSSVMASLDSYGNTLIDMYKKALAAGFCNVCEIVKQIKQELDSVEMLEIEERIIQPIIFQVESDKLRDITFLESFWQNVLTDMKNIIGEVVQFLLDAVGLWDRHNTRVFQSKKLVLHAVENEEKRNRLVLQELDIQLNIEIDSSRQEVNKAKLDKSYVTISEILEEMRSRLESCYITAVSIIEEFYKMMVLEADVLSSELKEFIYSLHKTTGTDKDSKQPKNVSTANSLTGGKTVQKQIVICLNQISGIRIWKKRLWTELEKFVNHTKESLQDKAENWVTEMAKQLAERLQVQLEILERRRQRIKIQVWQARSKEVEDHQRGFDQHQESAKQAFGEMKSDLKTLVEEEIERLMEIQNILLELEGKVKTEISVGVVKCIKIQVDREKKEFEKTVKLAFEEFTEDCKCKMSALQQSTLDLIRDMKLFIEGGGYNAEEVKSFATSLEGLIKDCDSELKNLFKVSAKEEGDAVKKGMSYYEVTAQNLSWMHEELQFSNKAMDKFYKCEAEMQQMASKLTLDLEDFSRQAKELSRWMENTGRPFSSEDDEMWSQIFHILYKNLSKLFFPVKTPTIPAVNVKSERTENESQSSPRSAATSEEGLTDLSTRATILSSSRETKGRLKPNFQSLQCKDLKSLLLQMDAPPEYDTTFMAQVCNQLWDNMDMLQRLGCDFYRKIGQRVIIRKELVPANYETFANEVLCKFQSYMLQCEQLWLHATQEFLPIFGQVKILANAYMERRMLGYRDDVIGKLNQRQIQFHDRFFKKRGNTAAELDKLDNKLIPLYGYPKNKERLENMEEDVAYKTAELEVAWQQTVSSYKKEVSNSLSVEVIQKTGADVLKTQCTNIRSALFADNLVEGIFTLILTVSERGGFIRKEQEMNWGTTQQQQQPNPSKERTDMMNIRQKLKILQQIAQGDASSEKESIESPDPDPTACRRNLLTTPFDFEKNFQNILQTFRQRLREIIRDADFKLAEHNEIISKWLENCKLNVAQICELFGVKYKQTPQGEFAGISVASRQY